MHLVIPEEVLDEDQSLALRTLRSKTMVRSVMAGGPLLNPHKVIRHHGPSGVFGEVLLQHPNYWNSTQREDLSALPGKNSEQIRVAMRDGMIPREWIYKPNHTTRGMGIATIHAQADTTKIIFRTTPKGSQPISLEDAIRRIDAVEDKVDVEYLPNGTTELHVCGYEHPHLALWLDDLAVPYLAWVSPEKKGVVGHIDPGVFEAIMPLMKGPAGEAIEFRSALTKYRDDDGWNMEEGYYKRGENSTFAHITKTGADSQPDEEAIKRRWTAAQGDAFFAKQCGVEVPAFAEWRDEQVFQGIKYLVETIGQNSWTPTLDIDFVLDIGFIYQGHGNMPAAALIEYHTYPIDMDDK